jgi:MOSC domain-containing protein YiiM
MSAMSASVVSVNVGRVLETPGSLLGRTGIDKRPVEGRVAAYAVGLAGDACADEIHHGGIDQAVYAFAREDMDRWERELGRELPGGAFGENLTTRGIDLNATVIGERWRVGDVEFEVSSPRTPCGTFQNHMKERNWVRRCTLDGRMGAYLRVITAGTVGAGDTIEVLSRPGHGLTTSMVFRAITTERYLLPKLLDAPQLPAKLLTRAGEYVAAQTRLLADQ